MKATHTGRLKSLHSLVNYWNYDHDKFSMQFLLDVAEKECVLRLEDNGVYTVLGYEDYRLSEVSIEDIQEIKPVCEIPETPFWFKDDSDIMFHIFSNENEMITGTNLDFGQGHNFQISTNELKSRLNECTWTICEAPEKKMIPWSSEELIEWIYSDGWYKDITDMPNRKGRLYKVNEFDAERKEIKSLDMVTFVGFMKMSTDRHGNKFEKEA